MARVIAFDVQELQSLADKLPCGKGCDFCATGLPKYRYPARDVGLGMIVYGPTVTRPISFGYWASCSECSDLIEAGDWPALAKRSLRSLNLDFSTAGPGFRVRLLAQVRMAQESFQRARCGPREVRAA